MKTLLALLMLSLATVFAAEYKPISAAGLGYMKTNLLAAPHPRYGPTTGPKHNLECGIFVTSNDEGAIRMARKLSSILTNGGYEAHIIMELDPDKEGVSVVYPKSLNEPRFKNFLTRLYSEIGQPMNVTLYTNSTAFTPPMFWVGRAK